MKCRRIVQPAGKIEIKQWRQAKLRNHEVDQAWEGVMNNRRMLK